MTLDFSIPMGAVLAIVVEDGLTRDYLNIVWDYPSEPGFVLAGGNDGVHAITRSFEEEGRPNVYGITDRDYRPSNRIDWEDPARQFRTFVLPVHEIENYLLNAEALHASKYHNRNLTVEAIEQRMVAKASDLCWWAACRDTIAELKRRFREQFIPDPKQTIHSETLAREHICGSQWYAKLELEMGRSGLREIQNSLAQNHLLASQRLQDGTWRQDFAGKELLRDVVGWFCDWPKIHRPPPSDSEKFANLAKEIGAWQVAQQAVPADLEVLRRAIWTRAGLVDR